MATTNTCFICGKKLGVFDMGHSLRNDDHMMCEKCWRSISVVFNKYTFAAQGNSKDLPERYSDAQKAINDAPFPMEKKAVLLADLQLLQDDFDKKNAEKKAKEAVTSDTTSEVKASQENEDIIDKAALNSVLVSTTNMIAGRTINSYVGYVFDIMLDPVLKNGGVGIVDIALTRSNTQKIKWDHEVLILKIKNQALELGADAIIGLHTEFSYNDNLKSFVCYIEGTAVKLVEE